MMKNQMLIREKENPNLRSFLSSEVVALEKQKKNGHEVWDREYDVLRVIPSSQRMIPSKALQLFSELIPYEKMERVLDLGCGTGRNAIYIAQKGPEVYGVDYSESALARFRSEAAKTGVMDKVHIYNLPLENQLPFGAGEFDLALDSYVFCHFLDQQMQNHYWSELRRLVREEGLVYSSVFSTDDEYYSRLIRSGNGSGRIVTDPNNGVTKHLYTEEEIKEFLSGYFDLLYFSKFQFTDEVLEKPFLRSILVSVLRK